MKTEEPVTTYTIRGKNSDNIWLFKYDLKGFLKAFIIEEGTLTKTQQEWLFNARHFPYNEMQMKLFSRFKNILVTKGAPDLSFETFYKTYNYAVGKIAAQKAYN